MASQTGWSLSRVRTRRLAYLLAGTALASTGFAPEATAVCGVNAAGLVICAANTTTTNTTSLNGGTGTSSDRIQEFNNGSSINAIINNGIVIDGFGLNLLLSNAGGNNQIIVTNDGHHHRSGGRGGVATQRRSAARSSIAAAATSPTPAPAPRCR